MVVREAGIAVPVSCPVVGTPDGVPDGVSVTTGGNVWGPEDWGCRDPLDCGSALSDVKVVGAGSTEVPLTTGPLDCGIGPWSVVDAVDSTESVVPGPDETGTGT